MKLPYIVPENLVNQTNYAETIGFGLNFRRKNASNTIVSYFWGIIIIINLQCEIHILYIIIHFTDISHLITFGIFQTNVSVNKFIMAANITGNTNKSAKKEFNLVSSNF